MGSDAVPLLIEDPPRPRIAVVNRVWRDVEAIRRTGSNSRKAWFTSFALLMICLPTPLSSLPGTQDGHGIDSRRSSRGQPAGHRTDDHDHRDGPEKHEGIVRGQVQRIRS